MKKSLCEELLQYYPDISEYEDLRSTYVANCAFNNFICYTAIMLNIVTIHAIRRTSSLQKTLKILLLSLAVSDVGVSLVGQPFYTSLLVKWLQKRNPKCTTYKGFVTITNFFTFASFFNVVAISVDRFLAIHLHLRYQELVTHKRVVAVVISIWTLSILLPLLALWFPDHSKNVIIVILVLGFSITILAYIRIYLALRRHQNQIQALQVEEAQTDEMTNFASLVKSAFSFFYVYLVILVCFSPTFICLVAIQINGPSIILKKFVLFSFTLVFLNSSLNPVIYCLKMRHIRHAVIDILRNTSWLRNRLSNQLEDRACCAMIHNCH